MRTLVVDDELVSRKKLQKIMDSFGECEAVDSGKAAIEAVEEAQKIQKPFDLIALDVSMPEMDGTEVLLEIRDREKENKIPDKTKVKIVMVTSHSDKDTVITCIQAGCDTYITKPFDRNTILNKLRKLDLPGPGVDLTVPLEKGSNAEKSENIVSEISARFEKGDIELPSLPEISVKFRKMRKRGSNLKEVADLLKNDAAISSKLIGVSNSTYYRGVTKNETLDQALGRLGLDVTAQFVDTICTRAFYDSVNRKYVAFTEKLWDHSLACAYASQVIAELLTIELPDDPFTLGLLHDVGKLLLIRIIDELDRKGSLDEVGEEEILETLEKLHADFGAALLKRWEFPEGFAQVNMYHDNIEDAESISKEVQVIHLGNLLAKSIGYGGRENGDIDLEGSASNKLLGMDSKMLDDVKGQVQAYMDGLGDILT